MAENADRTTKAFATPRRFMIVPLHFLFSFARVPQRATAWLTDDPVGFLSPPRSETTREEFFIEIEQLTNQSSLSRKEGL